MPYFHCRYNDVQTGVLQGSVAGPLLFKHSTMKKTNLLPPKDYTEMWLNFNDPKFGHIFMTQYKVNMKP